MRLSRNLNKSLSILTIAFFALATFVAGLFAVVAFQAKDLSIKKIETAVIQSERAMVFDVNMTLERALKLYTNSESFAVFDQACSPIYSTDLLIHPSTCTNRHSSFDWKEILSPSGKKMIIGFSTKFDLRSHLDEYRLILLPTIATYLVFICILTFIFLKLFIENPVNRISLTIDNLLKTKQFDIESFKSSDTNLLARLYDAVSRLIQEVVRFNREEEKLILSRQIAHDLRGPISILEDQFKTIKDANSLERIALKRIRDISDGLMPQSKPIYQTTNIRSLVDDLTQIYPQVLFRIKFLADENVNIRLPVSEIEMFRFLLNISKNSQEAGAKSIEIEANVVDNIFEISLQDDGEGTIQENVPKILQGFTSKLDGNGLGISAIHERLNLLRGELIIHTSPGNGFKTILRIPIFSSQEIKYALIDDDKIIRIGWITQAKKLGIDLKCFESVESFLTDHGQISHDTHIYVDSNLKNGMKGEAEAEKIAKKGFSTIFLATGYSASMFKLSDYPWIKGIATKSIPFCEN